MNRRERDHVLPQRLRELRRTLTSSYACQEFPSSFSTSAAAKYAGDDGRWTQQGKGLLAQAQQIRRQLRRSRQDGGGRGPGPGMEVAERAGALTTFARHDLDGSGHIGQVEWEASLRDEAVGVDVGVVSEAAAMLLFELVDDDLSGGIEQDEWVAFLTSGRMSCGSADMSRLEAEVEAVEARMQELRRRPHDERGLVPFDAAAVFDEAVSRVFPSCTRSILTESYLCHGCSCQEIKDGNTRAGRLRRWARHRAGRPHGDLRRLPADGGRGEW
eukprot:COSAG01_NODE_2926_length_6839_cov_5.363353_6_plen_272_part_00